MIISPLTFVLVLLAFWALTLPLLERYTPARFFKACWMIAIAQMLFLGWVLI